MVLRKVCLSLTWLLIVASTAAAQVPPAAAPAPPTPAATAPAAPTPAALTFDDKGAHLGEQLPNLVLHTIDNEPVKLSGEINGPTLIVTSSFTCPKSRSHYPELADLAAKYKDKLHVVILYVLEAHPAGDPSPYRNGKEDVTPENERDGILRRQPTTFDKRLTLAEAFKDRFSIKMPILVDGMDNWGWASVGAGPNMAILVDRNRVVRARQGWFDSATLTPVLDKLLAEPPAAPRSEFLPNPDKALFDQLQKDKVLEDNFFVSDAEDKWLEDAALAKLPPLLKKYPDLLTAVSDYQPRGDEGGETLLQVAVRNNRVAAVRILLDAGADPDRKTDWRAAPLQLAAENGDEQIIKLLLAKSKSKESRVPMLHAALLNDHPAAAQLFTAAGTPDTFFSQVARGNEPAVRAAIAKDESVIGRPDGLNNTPLDYAAATGQTAMVKLFTATRPELPKIEADDAAVIRAIRHGHAETLAALLASDGNPDSNEGSAGNALHLAVDAKSAAMVDALLKAHAKPNVSNGFGETPMHQAAFDGQTAIMKLLLDAGADINAKSGEVALPCGPPFPSAQENTPLHLAAEEGELAAVQFLIDHHAALNTESVDGKTALDDAKDDATRRLLTAAGAKKGSGKHHDPAPPPMDSPQ